MSASLVFPLTEVKEKGFVPVDVSVPSADFPDTLPEGELVGDIAVKGSLSQQDDEAVFEGSARGRWRVECTRCLTPVEGNYDAAVEQRSSIDGGPMDISDEVRQSIVLAQPMKTYCKPDCKGFCSVCRKNRNLGDCGHAQGGAESSTRPRLTPRPDKG
ncbi:MAG: YceD family protein [Elusimicrobiota bacterium]